MSRRRRNLIWPPTFGDDVDVNGGVRSTLPFSLSEAIRVPCVRVFLGRFHPWTIPFPLRFASPRQVGGISIAVLYWAYCVSERKSQLRHGRRTNETGLVVAAVI